MSITANRLPWRRDINVFMTPISHTNWNTNTVNASAIRNGYRVSSGAQNDEISYDVVLAKGTWTLELLSFKTPNVGIYTVQFNGITIGTIDGYAAGDTFNVRDSITGISVATTGKKRLRLLMATKNASSGNFSGAINHIQLRRTA